MWNGGRALEYKTPNEQGITTPLPSTNRPPPLPCPMRLETKLYTRGYTQTSECLGTRSTQSLCRKGTVAGSLLHSWKGEGLHCALSLENTWKKRARGKGELGDFWGMLVFTECVTTASVHELEKCIPEQVVKIMIFTGLFCFFWSGRNQPHSKHLRHSRHSRHSNIFTMKTIG